MCFLNNETLRFTAKRELPTNPNQRISSPARAHSNPVLCLPTCTQSRRSHRTARPPTLRIDWHQPPAQPHFLGSGNSEPISIDRISGGRKSRQQSQMQGRDIWTSMRHTREPQDSQSRGPIRQSRGGNVQACWCFAWPSGNAVHAPSMVHQQVKRKGTTSNGVDWRRAGVRSSQAIPGLGGSTANKQ
ncbi:hypothetical protein CCMA1212_007141 [Trichoderma ghanense]|uniref:Uncharacterized protein n=1 Tax=Trichoderma ghanense TaxID=65468 RepID=A0ABY2H0D4_9HYPO